jgi:hypothetical protein
MIFLLIPCPSSIIENRYLPNIGWNPIQCAHGFGLFMFQVLSPWFWNFIFHVLIFQPTKEKQMIILCVLNLDSYDLSMRCFKTQKIIWFNVLELDLFSFCIGKNVARKRCCSGSIVAMRC